jgi:hypothetical protein
MKVYGFEPTEKQINSAIDYMKSSVTFKAKSIERVLITNGVPETGNLGTYKWQCDYIAHRMADRLIQKLRKEGKISLVDRAAWEWVV